MERPRFVTRHPYWFVAIWEAIVILVYMLAGTLAHFLAFSNLGLYALANFALTVIAALALTVMGWWKVVGFRQLDRRSDLLYFVIPFIPMFINFIPGIEMGPASHWLGILATTLMVGFVEEVVFRGLMLQALRPRGVWKAALITAVLFGLTHAMNVLAGKSLAEDAAQVFYAVAIGLAFAALVLRTSLLWPLVLAHFLIDFVSMLQRPGFAYPPGLELLIVLGTAVIFTAYGLFILLSRRRTNPEAAPVVASPT